MQSKPIHTHALVLGVEPKRRVTPTSPVVIATLRRFVEKVSALVCGPTVHENVSRTSMTPICCSENNIIDLCSNEIRTENKKKIGCLTSVDVRRMMRWNLRSAVALVYI